MTLRLSIIANQPQTRTECMQRAKSAQRRQQGMQKARQASVIRQRQLSSRRVCGASPTPAVLGAVRAGSECRTQCRQCFASTKSAHGHIMSMFTNTPFSSERQVAQPASSHREDEACSGSATVRCAGGMQVVVGSSHFPTQLCVSHDYYHMPCCWQKRRRESCAYTIQVKEEGWLGWGQLFTCFCLLLNCNQN